MPKPDADDETDIVDPALETPTQTASGRKAPAPPYTHEGWVVTAAEQYGLSEERIASTPPAELKRRVVAALQRDAAVAQARPSQPAAPAPAAAEPEFDWGEVELDGGVKRKATEADFHPTLARAIKAAAATEKRAAKLEEELARERQGRAAQTAKDKVDEAFAALGLAKLYGDGGMDDFEPTAAEVRRRMAVFAATGIDFNKLPAKATLKAKIREAHEVLYGKTKPAAEADDEPVTTYAPANGRAKPGKNGHPTPEEWDQAGLGPATQRGDAKEPKGKAAATAAVREELRKRGLPTDNPITRADDQEAWDSLPE